MELIYRAWDGTEFRERSACERYEYNNPCIVMYNDEGRTSNPDEAFVVVLKHDDDDAKKFIELCEAQGALFNGITEDDYGLYVWDDNREEYFYVSDRIKEALKRYFKD